MVDPRDVGRILLDAARLVRVGEVVVFGSAALALWIEGAPRTRRGRARSRRTSPDCAR